MDPVLIPITAIVFGMVIPIVAILTKGKHSKKDTVKIFKELEALKKENLQLKERLENVETIVTEPDYDLNKTLNEVPQSRQKHLE